MSHFECAWRTGSLALQSYTRSAAPKLLPSCRRRFAHSAPSYPVPSSRDLYLRCTVLDPQGNASIASRSFKKTELISTHGLQPRDLRKIDSRVPNTVPTIFVRKSAILVNILHIRAMIKSDNVILFDHPGSQTTTLQSAFMHHLVGNLRQSSNMPYEFRALESMLQSVTGALETEMALFRELVTGLLDELEHDITPTRLRLLLQYSRKLSAFHQRARLVQEAIDEVLAQDEDLSAMYLSEGPLTTRAEGDHHEIEILLESFSKQVEEIVSEVQGLVGNVGQTQDIIELILDSSRNALLALDLKAAIATMGLTSGALLAALFGMNLTTKMEQHNEAFWMVSSIALVISMVVTTMGFRRVRQLRKIGLGQRFTNETKARDQRWRKL